MSVQPNVFDRIIQCIDEGLDVLGDSSKKTIYHHLEKNSGLRKKEIPQNPETFSRGLVLMFGEEGANIIERWITERLKVIFKLEGHSELTLVKAVDTIKKTQNENTGRPTSK